ncbi:cyclic AMP-responsive element-binding protein 3-like protein 3-B isoform X1 [Saccostrea cucullata]|uniref:cyclic AMP-responsive element-binding protein 3-like protein 3-B isoform X1 n=1 Tax=Saccostrea cuccullata TaxID=36930 RepID=UPI002ED1E263
MALLNTCLTDVLISPHSENDGLDNFLDELLRSSSLLTATKAGANCTHRLNNMDDSDSEATEQNLNALLPFSDSESNLSACESDQDNVLLNSDWDVTDDILSDLGLLPETDILENALIESHIPTFFDEEEPPKTKSQDVVHDHDYFAQKSPSAGSDSGISSNGAYSPHSMTDELQHSPRESSLSGSPRSQSNLDIQINSANENLGDTTPITLENFDFKNFDMSTIDAGAFLGDTDFLSLGDGTQDSDVTINVMDTDLMEDTVTSSSQTPMGSSTKMTKIIKVCTTKSDTLPFTMKDVSCVSSSSKFPELQLTDEERELLYKEGVTLPTNMPLTKEEERVLKAVRRKIRNKASAKESRKRKMTYVEGLEKRVKLSTTENNQLKKKVDTLEKQNSQLVQQLKKLQALFLSKTSKPQASTCLVVLVMSFAFLIVPNIDPFGIKKDKLSDPKSIPIPGKSRSLLHSPDEMQDIDTDPYGLTIKPGPPWEVPPKTPAIPLPPNVVIETVEEETVNKLIENTENTGPLNTSIDNITSQKTEVNQDTQEITQTQNHQHRQDL